MHSGITIAHRFTLRSPGTWRVAGAETWLADDARLGLSVILVVASGGDPDAVAAELTRIRSIRDPRLARLVDVGVAEVPEAAEEGGGDSATTDAGEATVRRAYAALVPPSDLTFADLLGSRVLPPPLARLLVQRAATALSAGDGLGLRHGTLAPSAIGVTPRGRIVVAGAGLSAAFSRSAVADVQTSDAVALAAFFARAVTGLDVDTAADEALGAELPSDLTGRERRLVAQALRGGGPDTVDGVLAVLGTTNGASLLDLRAQLLGFPRTLEPEPEPEREEEAVEPDVGPVAPAEGEEVDQWELERLLEEQRIDELPTLAEAIFDLLHRRFPRSERITSALERAHARALAGPKLNGARWTTIVMLLLVGGLAFFAVKGFNAPFNPSYDLNNPPPQAYPSFTFGPSPTPSPSHS